MDIEHIDTPRLFDAATAGLKLAEEEKAHLVICNECKEVFAGFSRQYAADKVSGVPIPLRW
jgi:hypothetical protein